MQLVDERFDNQSDLVNRYDTGWDITIRCSEFEMRRSRLKKIINTIYQCVEVEKKSLMRKFFLCIRLLETSLPYRFYTGVYGWSHAFELTVPPTVFQDSYYLPELLFFYSSLTLSRQSAVNQGAHALA